MCSSASVLCRLAKFRHCWSGSSGSIKALNNKYIQKKLNKLGSWNHLNCSTHESSLVFFNQKRFGSTSAAATTGTIPGVLSELQAKELAVRLTSEERKVLIDALQECQSNKLKAEYEGEELIKAKIK